jgi:hypothetical protein
MLERFVQSKFGEVDALIARRVSVWKIKSAKEMTRRP